MEWKYDVVFGITFNLVSQILFRLVFFTLFFLCHPFQFGILSQDFVQYVVVETHFDDLAFGPLDIRRQKLFAVSRRVVHWFAGLELKLDICIVRFHFGVVA